MLNTCPSIHLFPGVRVVSPPPAHQSPTHFLLASPSCSTTSPPSPKSSPAPSWSAVISTPSTSPLPSTPSSSPTHILCTSPSCSTTSPPSFSTLPPASSHPYHGHWSALVLKHSVGNCTFWGGKRNCNRSVLLSYFLYYKILVFPFVTQLVTKECGIWEH